MLAPERKRTPVAVLADRLHGTVAAFDPGRIRSDDLLAIENGLMQLSDEISYAFFRVRDPLAGEGGGT